ncbi:MAG TPA: OmpA family protein [Polyangiaceae bacterium]|nr:OmpA family protein [Polyangiaceae bacterium]
MLFTAPAAAEWRLHLTGAGAKAVRGYQKDEFGFGAYGAAALEYAIIKELGVQFELGGAWLAKGEPSALGYPSDWGWANTLFLGGRARPFASSYDGSSVASAAGLWASAAGGVVFTGNLVRSGVDAGLGWDLLFNRGRLGIGPMVGYLHIFESDDSPRPTDASVLIFGVHMELFADRSRSGGSRDSDGDGIENSVDACPESPEDFDEFQDQDGCPESDNDRDGITDALDKCPLVPEDLDSYQDEDGCPDPDNDSDGIPDTEDLCPNEKETVNGYADHDGCPDVEQVRVVGEKIVLDEQVLFETNLSEIRPESNKLLERLVNLLNQHPEYSKVSVDGHTDERGSDELNQRLSEERAKSVMNFLVAHGVSADRLSARGFGASQPRIDRGDPLAYALNRRVEFHVTREHVAVPRDQATEQKTSPAAQPPAAPVKP